MRPRPKFCVGEEVLDISIEPPIRCEVQDSKWTESEENAILRGETITISRGWHHKLSHDGCYTHENVIRKLPPSERTQWKDTHFQPTDEEVTL